MLIRVPLAAGLPAGQLHRNLELLLEGLRSLGLTSFLVAPPGAPEEARWDLVEGKASEFFETRLDFWARRPPAGARELAAALENELIHPAVAGIARLAVVLPMPPAKSSPMPSDLYGFGAVVELGGAPKRHSSFFAYPRQAVALLSHVGQGISGPPPPAVPREGSSGRSGDRHPPAGDDRSLGASRGEEPPILRSDPPFRGDAESVAESEVYLGVGLPDQVGPGEFFVARFAAYTAAFRKEVRRILREEAPEDRQRLDLERSRWKIGTRVAVRLAAEGAKVEPAVQDFSWDGKRQVLRFDVAVEPGLAARRLVLRFDLFIAGLQVLSLRPEVALADSRSAPEPREIEVAAPKSAFASYASEDEKEVLGRVRSVEISTGMNIFVDRLSIRPGERWHQVLEEEIARRDVFWLFWSRHAMESEYVAWEWQTALREKTLDRILPHPLEPANLAPPPAELSGLQFGGAYEAYLSSLGKPG